MPSDLPVALQAARARAGLSLEDVTAKTGIPADVLRRYEAGRTPDFTTLERIASALGTDLPALLGESYIVIAELRKMREELDAVRSAIENMQGRGVR
jgi:transcriptional regulator with XRE-family HTH domain